ncbi:hypothetical protein RchiOBHm_Chr1g0384141 [Rosa chinensis]|uniref:KRR1 small subunit processome component first KH domain-containing protein n=1 Tax=Rosa chinensis TaxID=74649 RepID=A0A2P6SPT0_ROSCH|nr:hypothetical protein RchiOBHm_Chr1g0384141 [Rosa chinensis]
MDENSQKLDNTGYESMTLLFKKQGLCKEENLNQVWKKEVETVFESHGLSCELNWDECKMTVSATERTQDRRIIYRGARALCVLACGLGTEWVEPIVSGSVHSDVMKITIPDGMTEDDFSSKYHDFIFKFEDKFGLPRKLSCFVLYQEAAVVVLSDKAGSTSIVRNLVTSCLLGDDPFDEDHFHELFLDDV